MADEEKKKPSATKKPKKNAYYYLLRGYGCRAYCFNNYTFNKTFK